MKARDLAIIYTLASEHYRIDEHFVREDGTQYTVHGRSN